MTKTKSLEADIVEVLSSKGNIVSDTRRHHAIVDLARFLRKGEYNNPVFLNKVAEALRNLEEQGIVVVDWALGRDTSFASSIQLAEPN